LSKFGKSFLLLMLIAVLISSGCSKENNMVKIDTPRGAELTAYLDLPEGDGPFPAVVVAPGLGYNATLPLFDSIAQKCVDKGIACLRFEWDFFTRGADPSENYSDELEDYSAAIDFLKQQPKIDKDKIFLSGKSLGAQVAINYAVDHPDFAGLIVLTPPLHNPRPPLEIRPSMLILRDVKLPTAIIYGDSDPICHKGMLDNFLADSSFKPEVFQVRGSHSFQGDSEEETARNIDNASGAFVDFIVSHIKQ
jgi:dienelactone hydrolase